MKRTKLNKFLYTACLTTIFLGAVSCKDQLDVGNPNAPTIAANVNTETGLISLAQGGVYINGFANTANGSGWLGDSYFSLPWGYSELMADFVGADASNNQVSTIGLPDYFILDDKTKVSNSGSSIGTLRGFNTRASTGGGNNVVYYQWLSMYAMNNACNTVLSLVDGIKFSGDAASRSNTIKAWCYFWKGYAYASIGSMYYSGLINEKANTTDGNYVLHDAIITQSNTLFNQAATTLASITSVSDYQTVLGQLIPKESQTGNGGILTVDMWKRNINTMLARNILVNKLAPFVNNNPSATITKSSTSNITTADWNSILTLATNGIKQGDLVFTGRNTSSNYFFSPTGGTVGALAVGPNSNTTFTVTERFIQNFKPGDKRFTSNFNTSNTYHNSFNYTTRYSLNDADSVAAGVHAYGSIQAGVYELFIAGSYEENALMLAEANMRLGNTEAGLAYIDAERTYQGAGIAPTVGTKLTLAGALTELVKERKVALFGRGLSFYDNRRWGWTYDIANGGGSYGNTLLYIDPKTNAVVVNKNVTIDYDFLDYWDVPADESVLNPSTSGVATKNPNF